MITEFTNSQHAALVCHSIILAYEYKGRRCDRGQTVNYGPVLQDSSNSKLTLPLHFRIYDFVKALYSFKVDVWTGRYPTGKHFTQDIFNSLYEFKSERGMSENE